MANILDVLMAQDQNAVAAKGIDARTKELSQTHQELADLVGQTKTVVEADAARRAKAESDANQVTAESFDADPTKGTSILNTLGRSIATKARSVDAINTALVAMEDTSILSDPIKYLGQELFVRPGMEAKKALEQSAISDNIDNMKGIVIGMNQGYEVNKKLGVAISAQEHKNALEYIGARAALEMNSEDYKGLAWQSASLAAVADATSAQLKQINEQINQGNTAKQISLSEQRFVFDKDTTAKQLNLSEQRFAFDKDQTAFHNNLLLADFNLRKQAFELDINRENRAEAKDKAARDLEDLTVSSFISAAAKNPQLAMPGITDRPVRDPKLDQDAQSDPVLRAKLAAEDDAWNRSAYARIKALRENPKLKDKIAQIEYMAAHYMAQGMAKAAADAKNPRILVLNGQPVNPAADAEANTWVPVYGNEPYAAMRGVDILGGLPKETTEQERALNSWHREVWQDLSTVQVGELSSTGETIRTGDSKSNTDSTSWPSGNFAPDSSGSKSSSSSTSIITNIRSKYKTLINPSNSEAENAAIFNTKVQDKAQDYALNVESGGDNIYKQLPVATWEQIGPIKNSVLYKEVIAPLIVGGVSDLKVEQIVDAALDAVEHKKLKKDSVQSEIANLYQNLAAQNNRLANFAGHGTPVQQTWFIKQQNPITGEFKRFDMMSNKSISNIVALRQYMRARSMHQGSGAMAKFGYTMHSTKTPPKSVLGISNPLYDLHKQLQE